MSMEIAPGITRLESDYPHVCGFPLWVHTVQEGNDLVLLDAGVASTPEAALRGELRSAGLDLSDITLVVNSHAHPDHMGGNSALKRLSGAKFAGPAREVEWLHDNDLLLAELWGDFPEAFRLSDGDIEGVKSMLGERVQMDHLLKDGDALPTTGSSMHVVVTSGHSPGHLAVYASSQRALFTFDDVQGMGTPWLDGDTVLAPLYHSRARYLTGLQRLQGLDFDLLVPAHGKILDRDAGLKLIEQSIEFVHSVDAFVQRHLQLRGRATVREMAHAIGTELGPYGGVGLQTAAVARAHLSHLAQLGVAEPTWALLTERNT